MSDTVGPPKSEEGFILLRTALAQDRFPRVERDRRRLDGSQDPQTS